MRKSGKLYTANKYNPGLFASDVDRENQNIFDGSTISNLGSSLKSSIGNNLNNTLSNSKLNSGSSGGSSDWSAYASAAANALGDSTVSEEYKRGAWDALDPSYHLANGNESNFGNAFSDTGVMLTKAGLQSGNGYIALAGAASKIIGSLANAGWGHGENEKTIAAVNANNGKIKRIGSNIAQATTNEDFMNYASQIGGKASISKDGFTNGWFNNDGDNAYNGLVNSQNSAYLEANNDIVTGATNVDKIQDSNVNRNFIYAFGGDMQSNSLDFPTGLTHIDAGNSHEENPYDGVQVGISQENGKPNLVEEGETIFDDYVYSRRIKLDDSARKRFHLGKKADISYADASKKLEKQASERPNDPIAKRGLEKQMHDLADEQERQKDEMKAQRAQEQFAQLPPEQQQAIIQQIAMQNQQNQPVSPNTQVEGEIPMEGEAPVEQPTMEQQIAPEGESGVEISAMGGDINRFDYGGALNWLRKNHPGLKEKDMQTLARIIYKRAKMNGVDDPKVADFVKEGKYEEAYDYYRPTHDLSDDNVKKYYEQAVSMGLSPNAAFIYTVPREYRNSSNKYGFQTKDGFRKYSEYRQTIMGDDSSSTGKVKSLSGKVFSTHKEARQDNYKYLNKLGEYATAKTKEEDKKKSAVTTKEKVVVDNNKVKSNKQDFTNRDSSKSKSVKTSDEAAKTSTSTVSSTSKDTAPVSTVGSIETPSVVNTPAITTSTNSIDNARKIQEGYYNALGIHTEDDYNKWAKDNNIDEITDWNTARENKSLINAVAKSNPALADAISKGYNFDITESPDSKDLTFDFTHGGWGAEDYNAWNGSTDPAWKEAVANGSITDKSTSEDIAKALSTTKAYQKGTKWLQDSDANRLAYLQAIYNSKDAPKAAKDYAAKYVNDKGWLEGAKTDYNTIFGDVRTTHPGTFWKTPDNVAIEPKTANYVLSDDGKSQEIIGNVPTDWVSAGSYSWGNNTANYYKKPVETDTTGSTEEQIQEYEPKYVDKNGVYRKLGLLGPTVGLGMMAAGVGKPDYSEMDTIVHNYPSPTLATTRTLGDYMTYKPMDIWPAENRNDANARATDRAILNSNSPIGTKMAGLIANGYNSQIANGQLFRQSQEYNDNLLKQTKEYNRGTNQFNASAINQTSATNAGIINAANQARTSLAIQAALQKMEGDASWYNSLYGNVNNLFKGISDYGKETETRNMLADMLANNVFGNATDKQFPNYLRRKKIVANGGKINRKKK